jgi:hypothetical protein
MIGFLLSRLEGCVTEYHRLSICFYLSKDWHSADGRPFSLDANKKAVIATYCGRTGEELPLSVYS